MTQAMEAGMKSQPRVHLIWAHPRIGSLTSKVVEAIKNEATTQGIDIAELDLYRSGFNPVLQSEDEPDWANPAKIYSKEARCLAESLDGSVSLVLVFPLWWSSLPAMLKGYIDRVWNYGLVYGNGKSLPVSSIRWIALVGGAKKNFEDHKKDHYLEDYLNNGIASYCGVQDSTVTFLYNTIAFEEETSDLGKHHEALITQAKGVIIDLATEIQKEIAV
jgi:putative NADPH-quinone reductase